ncbi:PilT domain-containing protein [Calothrix sp. NIES-4071]|nr:PilT domain-containing protein [Calothrix sp. NIES-4071]BAZ56611.1 PilT domain-containing protein [Calothrix sp. NIES-4105]
MNGVKQDLILLDTNIALYFLGGRLVHPLQPAKYLISVITEMELLSYPNLSSYE